MVVLESRYPNRWACRDGRMSCQPSGLVFLSGSTRLSYSRVVYPVFWSSVKVDYADPMPSVRPSVCLCLMLLFVGRFMKPVTMTPCISAAAICVLTRFARVNSGAGGGAGGREVDSVANPGAATARGRSSLRASPARWLVAHCPSVCPSSVPAGSSHCVRRVTVAFCPESVSARRGV